MIVNDKIRPKPSLAIGDQAITNVSKPDGNIELTLHAGPVLHVLEDVDWLLAVAVDVDWTAIHLREGLQEITDQEMNDKSASQWDLDFNLYPCTITCIIITWISRWFPCTVRALFLST